MTVATATLRQQATAVETARRRLPRRHGDDRRTSVAGDSPRPRDGDPADLHRAVLLPREHRHPVRSHRGTDRGIRLHRVPTADGDPARRHRRVAGSSTRARRAERLLRPPAAHAGATPGDPARPHGGRRHRGLRVDRSDPHRRVHRRRPLRDRAARRPRVHRSSERCGAWRSRGSGMRSRSRPATPGRSTRASCCSSRSCS